MKKILEPAKDAIAEHYCDGCHSLVAITGLPEDEIPVIDKEFSVALKISMGYNSSTPGLFADLQFCETCAIKLINLIENEFSIKIETPLFAEGE